MPYMGRFPVQYLVSYFTGVSFGGLISSLITLMQGIGREIQEEESWNGTTTEMNVNEEEPQIMQEPNISVSTFFLIISGIFSVSTLAFYLIDTVKAFKMSYDNVEIRYGNDYTFNSPENQEMSVNADNSTIKANVKQLKKLSPINYQNLMCLTVVISAIFNAIVPGILSYATLPFGTQTYHYTITFVYIGEPLAYMVANFLPHSNIRLVWILSAFTTIPCSYILTNAVMSPNPPLIGTLIGSILTVSVI